MLYVNLCSTIFTPDFVHVKKLIVTKVSQTEVSLSFEICG